tara:strand:- start:882 stop:1139 length:258 start_codon:yes stop_codon:yes gene_type:complete
MSYHKIEPEFDVGDLVHLEAFNLTNHHYSDKSVKIAVVISGPNYGMSMTYHDWEVLDEPLYDILCAGKLHKNVPQRFMQKMEKNS